MMPRALASISSFALLLVPSAAPAPAVPFSADLVHTSGAQTSNGTFNYQDGNYRFELTSGGEKLTVLFDGRRAMTRILNAQEKAYVEAGPDDPRALFANPFSAYASLAKKNSERTEGTATVAGISCTKHVVFSGEQVLLTACVAAEFGVPLKIEIPVYRLAVELRNIKRGPQPPALFQLPAGYSLKADEPEPVRQPDWAAQVARAPKLAPPFERTMAEGNIVRVPTQAGRSIAIEGTNTGKGDGSFTAAPFKGGKSLGPGEMGTYDVSAGESGTMTVGAQPPNADEVVIRVGKGPLKVKVTYVAPRTAPSP